MLAACGSRVSEFGVLGVVTGVCACEAPDVSGVLGAEAALEDGSWRTCVGKVGESTTSGCCFGSDGVLGGKGARVIVRGLAPAGMMKWCDDSLGTLSMVCGSVLSGCLLCSPICSFESFSMWVLELRNCE